MMTSTMNVSHFILSAYFDTGVFKHFCFMIVMLLYILILGSNILLIVVICYKRSLHEPMYLLLLSLFVDELLGSTSLLPFLLNQILSEFHSVSVQLCFLQIFFLYTYASVQLSNLSVMSYDRYLAICFPLRYNALMNLDKTIRLIFVIWFYPVFTLVLLVSMTANLKLCGNKIHNVFCDNYSVVKLVCSNTTIINVYGLVIMFLLVIFPAGLILYSYTRILKVCFSGSKETRQKAVSTCTPHLASLINFSFGCVFEILQSRFDMSRVPSVLRAVLAVYYLTCQPLFNPVLYGLNMSKIRSSAKCLLTAKKLFFIHSK